MIPGGMNGLGFDRKRYGFYYYSFLYDAFTGEKNIALSPMSSIGDPVVIVGSTTRADDHCPAFLACNYHSFQLFIRSLTILQPFPELWFSYALSK